jgi:hypothetical protein
VGTARRSRGIAHHGRGRGWCRGRVPPDKPENTKRIVRNKRDLKKCEKTNDHYLRRAPARLTSASSLARCLLLLPALELLRVLVLKRESIDWRRLGKQRTW